MIPSLSDLQRLFPIGPIELDAQARRELSALAVLRNTFITIKERAMKETTCPEVIKRFGRRFSDIDEVEASMIAAAQLEEIIDIMETANSSEPGLDVAAVQDHALMVQEFREKLAGDSRTDYSLLTQALAGGSPDSAMCLIAAGLLAAITGMMRYSVTQCMYRKHPEVRFPIQGLVHVVIDPSTTGQSVHVTINGYAVDILRDLKSDTKFKAPDTAEEFLRGHSDKGADNANNPT